MKKGIAGHQTHGGREEWLTPRWLVDELGPFDLDPCSPIERPWPTAWHHYTIEDDGLSLPWFGRVWCNPPYDDKSGAWLDRCADHGNAIALIFARTETQTFEKVWQRAHGLLFLRGRLTFHYVDGTKARANGGAPSVLIAYNADTARHLREAWLRGHYVPLR